MNTKHTPGPWRFEFNEKHRQVYLAGGDPKFDLTIMEFCRWGVSGATLRLRDTAHDGRNLMYKLQDRPDWISPQKGREHHKSWHQLLTHPDIKLMEAAPDMLDALKLLLASEPLIAEATDSDLADALTDADPQLRAQAAAWIAVRTVLAKIEGGAP